jgi:phenylalanine-4-hydroxylase
VCGFIPPAAFMEFHALGILPISREIRKPANLEYTPAPDIIHEAACHVPLLSNREYGQFMKRFGELALRTGFSRDDERLHEAIRILSDLKESWHATDKEIDGAEAHLAEVAAEVAATRGASPGARLTRLFWWTAEYGLIGSLDEPKLYGAGLLSSLAESRTCLDASVEKLPLTLDCIEIGFDITRPQPQLFVTPDFETLFELLEGFADRCL